MCSKAHDFQQRPNDRTHPEGQRHDADHDQHQAGEPQHDAALNGQQGRADAEREHPADGDGEPSLHPHAGVEPFDELHQLHVSTGTSGGMRIDHVRRLVPAFVLVADDLDQ